MNITKKIRGIFYKCINAPINMLRFGQFGKSSVLEKYAKIDSPKRIYIGSKVLIASNAWLAAEPLTGNNNCKLIIGDGTYIGRFSHIYSTSLINIGKKVLIADKVYISDNLHGYKNVALPIIDQPIEQQKEVCIGEGSWIGENVCIIGANIGKHCVIGANAVVSKNIPDYCEAVGIPAKIVNRYNFELQQWQNVNAQNEFL